MSRSYARGSQGWAAVEWMAHPIEPTAARRRRIKQEKAQYRKRAMVVDRSGSLKHLERAAKRLRSVEANERVLCVQHWNLDLAMEAMRRAGVDGLVMNLCASEQRRVEKRRY